MKKRICLLLTALVWVVAFHPLHGASAQKPNIVILLSDDMGWAYPGFTGGLVEMPNIDRLAQKALNLTQFYVQPVCTPSRASLLTGRYPMHTGTEGRFEGNDTGGMLTDERTIAQGLRDAGYFTAIFGKWHLGGWQAEHLPLARGFDYQYGFYGALIDYYRKMRLKKGPINYEREVAADAFTYDWHRNQQPLVQNGYTTYLIADEVESVLEKRDPAKPFFFYVAFNASHSPSSPSQIPPELKGKYPAVRHTQAFCFDQAVGRIVDSLAKRNLIDNTILIFLNDNGGIARPKDQERENGPWRGGKGSYYEGGIRVPCLVSWPAKINEPRKVDALLHVVDFYPTLLKIAGGSVEQPLPPDGKDMSALLEGGSGPVRDEIAFSQHVIRKGDWKLIEKEQGYQYPGEEPGQGNRPADELFNLRLDPSERTNVADANPDVVKQLRAVLAGYAKTARQPEEHGRLADFTAVTIMGEEEAKTFSGVEYVKQDGVYTIEARH